MHERTESAGQPRQSGAVPLRPGENPHRLTAFERVGWSTVTVGGLLFGWFALALLLTLFDLAEPGLLAPFTLGLLLMQIGNHLVERVAPRTAAVKRRQPYRAEAEAKRRAKMEQEEAQRREERELANRPKVDQFIAWDYDVAVRDLDRWPPRGFVRYDVLNGSTVNGQPTPAYSTLLVQLAPPDRPHLVARIAPQQPGPPRDILIDDLIRVVARSRGATWFGFGAGGAMAAHAAASLDRHLAGHELMLVSHCGYNLRLRVLYGAPPEAQLQTIDARISGFAY